MVPSTKQPIYEPHQHQPTAGGDHLHTAPNLHNHNQAICVHGIGGKKLWDLTQHSRARFSDAIDRLNCHRMPLLLLFCCDDISHTPITAISSLSTI
ncbi:hypothetical protein niasHS_009925 [Heterodera schachtii]|uniref:Uncharacterized protein n=1 Tax=Heterodera schachtii TaxID=97005 RepID=A0ABD2JCX7_HETSC